MEEQQSQASQTTTSSEQKDNIAREKAEKLRKIQGLELTRARLREQKERSTNERYNELLTRELEHIEKQLAELKG